MDKDPDMPPLSYDPPPKHPRFAPSRVMLKEKQRRDWAAEDAAALADTGDLTIEARKRILSQLGANDKGEVGDRIAALRERNAMDRGAPDVVGVDWQSPSISTKDLLAAISGKTFTRDGAAPIIEVEVAE